MKPLRILFAASLFVHLAPHCRGANAGLLDTSFNPSNIPFSAVSKIAVQPDGKIIISKYYGFSYPGDNEGVVRLNSDGSLDNSFDLRAATNYGNTLLALQPDGKILIAGPIDLTNNTLGGIIRLNSDGSVDGTFSTDPRINGLVTLQSDGKLVIVGYYARSLLRLNADGSLDTSYNATTYISWPIAIVLQPDGKLIVGGDPVGIVRFNLNGSLDESFSAATGVPPGAMVLQPDGKILVGGRTVTRLNADGTLDGTFKMNFTPLPSIVSMAVQEDGKVLIAGGYWRDFNTAYILPLLRRLDANGNLDIGFGQGWGSDSPNSTVAQVLLQPDGRILIGGIFTSVDGVARKGVARLFGGPSNRLPVADASATKKRFVSANGSNAVVTLDGSRSFDPDGDPLTYFWYAMFQGEFYRSGAVLSAEFELGMHNLYFEVSDGRLRDWSLLEIEVLTSVEAVERLLAEVQNQSLRAILNAALASIDRGHSKSAANQLEAFQQQIRVRFQSAEALIQDAQSVIEALRSAP